MVDEGTAALFMANVMPIHGQQCSIIDKDTETTHHMPWWLNDVWMMAEFWMMVDNVWQCLTWLLVEGPFVKDLLDLDFDVACV